MQHMKKILLGITTTKMHHAPPVPVPPNSSNSIDAAHTTPSSNWTTWNLSQGINSVNDPSPSIKLSSLTPDPWTVNAQDTQDSIYTRVEKLKDSGESAPEVSQQFLLILLQDLYLGS
jgi:hypothetical protein